MNDKPLLEVIEETALRLQRHLRIREFSHKEWFLETNKKPDKELIEAREVMDDFDDYRFYAGKLYAYLWVLKLLGSDVAYIIEKERGTTMIKKGLTREYLPYLEGNAFTRLFRDIFFNKKEKKEVDKLTQKEISKWTSDLDFSKENLMKQMNLKK